MGNNRQLKRYIVTAIFPHRFIFPHSSYRPTNDNNKIACERKFCRILIVFYCVSCICTASQWFDGIQNQHHHLEMLSWNIFSRMADQTWNLFRIFYHWQKRWFSYYHYEMTRSELDSHQNKWQWRHEWELNKAYTVKYKWYI